MTSINLNSQYANILVLDGVSMHGHGCKFIWSSFNFKKLLAIHISYLYIDQSFRISYCYVQFLWFAWLSVRTLISGRKSSYILDIRLMWLICDITKDSPSGILVWRYLAWIWSIVLGRPALNITPHLKDAVMIDQLRAGRRKSGTLQRPTDCQEFRVKGLYYLN